MQPYRDTGLSGIKSPDPAPDYSLLQDKIQTRSPGINLLFSFFNNCTPVLDGEDPLASSDEEVEMTTPGQPPSTPAATPTGIKPHSSRASSSGSGTTPSHHGGGSGIASSSLMAQIRQLKKAASAPRIISGHSTARTSNYSSLIQQEDSRHTLAHHREL